MDRMFVWVIANKASCDVPKKDRSGIISALNTTSAFNIVVISGLCAELFNAAFCCVTPV